MAGEQWGGQALAEAAAQVRAALPGCEAEVAVVLGSGLGGFVDTLTDVRAVDFADVPHMPRASVAGHAGALCHGRLAGRAVWVLQGRVHLYEGHPPQAVAFGVRLLQQLGARTLVLTNASGGIDPQLQPGDLVCIEDHLNLTGQSCLSGPNEESLGPRFPDMSQAYDPALIALAEMAAARLGQPLGRGVYAGVLGPSYETPAEIRMLAALGASLVGMSTVQETIAARHGGMRVLGLSCVTNHAAGVSGSGEPLTHADVQRVAQAAASRLVALLSAIVSALPEGRP